MICSEIFCICSKEKYISREMKKLVCLQSVASSRAKNGGALFSAVSGFIQDPIAVRSGLIPPILKLYV